MKPPVEIAVNAVVIESNKGRPVAKRATIPSNVYVMKIFRIYLDVEIRDGSIFSERP